jgi:hypothetical protein
LMTCVPEPDSTGGQQAGEKLDDVARDVERGNIGDQREASSSADDLVNETVLPGASRLSMAWAPHRETDEIRCCGVTE